MKVIIAGSRTITNSTIIDQVMNRIFMSSEQPPDLDITEIVSGKAKKGIDKLGELWAEENGIPVKAFPALWGKHGLAAGPIRNEQMAKYADAAIIIWDGFSRGSKDMINKAKKHGLSTWVYNQSKNTLDFYPMKIK